MTDGNKITSCRSEIVPRIDHRHVCQLAIQTHHLLLFYCSHIHLKSIYFNDSKHIHTWLHFYISIERIKLYVITFVAISTYSKQIKSSARAVAVNPIAYINQAGQGDKFSDQCVSVLSYNHWLVIINYDISPEYISPFGYVISPLPFLTSST